MERKENEITGIIVDCAIKLHAALGPGLLESVYQVALAHDLEEQGLWVQSEKPISIQYKTLRFDEGFRADLVVNDMVIVELKSVQKILDVHKNNSLHI